MAKVYAYRDLVPVVDPSAFVHPDAVLIGDVLIGPGCYVGPGASLRGDMGRLVMEEGSNLQDNCIVHCFPGKDTVIAANGHVGHGATLHGCEVGRNALVGMNSVVMDNAVIGECAFVAALSFVRQGFEVPARTLVAGVPAKILRELSEDEIAWKTAGTEEYQSLARSCRDGGLVACAPRSAPEPGRPRLDPSDLKPLKENRQTAKGSPKSG